MKYTINENIIFFKESLSLENITELKDVLESELDSLGTHLQFDMQEVTSLDTAVLQYFLCLKRNLLKNNKNLELRSISYFNIFYVLIFLNALF